MEEGEFTDNTIEVESHTVAGVTFASGCAPGSGTKKVGNIDISIYSTTRIYRMIGYIG